MDQGIFLFDNQYHPEIIDRVYNQVLETTWDHCIEAQKATCQTEIMGGPLTDFVCDEALNTKMGFPAGSYTHFIKRRLLSGNQKYILEHFIRGKELLTIREMLQNNRFTKQFIFHIADYTFMNLQCRVVQNGTWLVIPIGTTDGISQKQMDLMMNDYDNPYTPSRWALEIRPKVSYAYKETNMLNLLQSCRIYLDDFETSQQFYKAEDINDWKVCVSEMSADLNLLRATPGVLMFTDDGRPYIEVSQAFQDHIYSATFNVKCFIYNEAHKAGFTLSPNYIGPTQYLKDNFDEYVDTINEERLKVVAMNADGGYAVLDGVDKNFDEKEQLVSVGFFKDRCWISIPTKDGTAPLYPGNFRVWEYDRDTDTLGRLVCTDMEAKFPNFYYYTMQSDCYLLYIEWFRDDESIGSNYDDFTEMYRSYIGSTFSEKFAEGQLPDVITNFEPKHYEFSANDFVKQILMYSSHEYRIDIMQQLLKETGMHYDEINTPIDAANSEKTTLTFRLNEEFTELYDKLTAASYGELCVARSADNLRPYDLYIDGVHASNTRTYWRDFDQYITIPSAQLKKDSTIIVDLYEHVAQVCGKVTITGDFMRSMLGDNYPLKYISANDLVVSNEEGTRISPKDITYGIYADEYLVQIPEKFVDWDALGINIFDPRISNRVGYTHPEGEFRSVVFRLIQPTTAFSTKLKTDDDVVIATKDGIEMTVRAGNVFVSSEGYDLMDTSSTQKFSKRVRSRDLALKIEGYDSGDIVEVRNANVWRRAVAPDLSQSTEAVIPSFCGADDPTRIIVFVNGILRTRDEVDGQIPEKVNGDFKVTFNGSYTEHSVGEAVYLPFPTDRFDVLSDENGFINLAYSGVMGISAHDMIFEDGLRIPTEDLFSVTNQWIKAPKPNTMYSIIRQHRDSNLFAFDDTNEQSFMDKLFQQSPGFKQYVMSMLDDTL